MRVKNDPRLLRSNASRGMLPDQSWRNPALWQTLDSAQGLPQNPMVSSMVAMNSSVPGQVPKPPFAGHGGAQSGLENATRPLPHPPLSSFPQGPAINLAPTFERMSLASSSAKQMPQHPMQFQALTQPYGGSAVPFHPDAIAPHAQQPYPSSSLSDPTSFALDPKDSVQSRKQAEIQGSSWRRSDDARNYIQDDGHRKMCPNRGNQPYQACTCGRCNARNCSIFVQVINFQGEEDSLTMIPHLKAALVSRVGQIVEVHFTGNPSVSCFIVRYV